MAAYKAKTLNDDQRKILALLSVGTAEEEIAEKLSISTQNYILKKIKTAISFGQSSGRP